MDEGNVKLVPPSKTASNDKNIETICPAPESQVRFISSKMTSERKLKSDKRGPDHELDSSKRENRSEDAQEAEDQQSSSSLDTNDEQTKKKSNKILKGFGMFK